MKKQFLSLSLLLCFSAFSQYAIGVRTITYNDPSRTGGVGSGGGPGRQIECAVYYPATSAGNNTPVADGVFPVVVFGHGFAMQWSAYQNVWEHLTLKGYIMVFPKTESSIFPAPSHSDFALDLAVASNRMLNENQISNSPFFQKVNGRSAIMGHSMGGGATMLAAQNNDNIKTIIGLAPAETNPSAIAVTSNITVPALILSGSSDGVTPPDEHHLPIYNGLSSLCKSFVNIQGGAHCYFANTDFACDFGEGTSSSGISISRLEQQAFMNSLVTPWLDFYLKGNCDGYTQFQTAASSNGLVLTNNCNYMPISYEVTVNNASSGQNNGSAFVSISGGSFPVDITWFNGSSNPEITGMGPGTYDFTITDAYCSTSGSVTIETTSSLVGEKFDSIQIFPNPALDYLNIMGLKTNFASIIVYDASGRVASTIDAKDQNEYTLNVSNLNFGVYFVKVSSDSGESQTFRIIVK